MYEGFLKNDAFSLLIGEMKFKRANEKCSSYKTFMNVLINILEFENNSSNKRFGIYKKVLEGLKVLE